MTPNAGNSSALLEWIEDLDSETAEVPRISCGEREIVAACDCRDVTVRNISSAWGILELGIELRFEMIARLRVRETRR